MAPVETFRLSMHDGATLSKQTLTTGLSSLSSLQPSTFRRAVMYAGLSMGLRASAINELVAKLESVGFGTRESLGKLSDDIAASLDIPRSLTAALRVGSGGPQSWRKSGPLPAFAELPPDETIRIPPIKHAYPTFEATEHGFPCKLRDYTPVSSPRLSPRSVVREASCRAEADHKCRMDRARAEREMEFGHLRISAQRREPLPDSWKISSFSERSSSLSKITATGRGLAGLATPRQSCQDRAPQCNRDMLRYNSSPGFFPKSPRQNSLERCQEATGDIALTTAQRSRREPLPQRSDDLLQYKSSPSLHPQLPRQNSADRAHLTQHWSQQGRARQLSMAGLRTRSPQGVREVPQVPGLQQAMQAAVQETLQATLQLPGLRQPLGLEIESVPPTDTTGACAASALRSGSSQVPSSKVVHSQPSESTMCDLSPHESLSGSTAGSLIAPLEQLPAMPLRTVSARLIPSSLGKPCIPQLITRMSRPSNLYMV